MNSPKESAAHTSDHPFIPVSASVFHHSQHKGISIATMKLLYAILPVLSFAPTISATIVRPSTVENCRNNIGDIRACGDTGLRNYNVRSAYVDYQGQQATFYRNSDCSGARISVASDQCVKRFPFRPLCVRISC